MLYFRYSYPNFRIETFRFPFFDDSITPFNEIFTLIVSAIAQRTLAMILSVSSIFITAVMTLKSHFEILQYQLRTIQFTRSEQDTIKLRTLIQYHSEILEISYCVNRLFHFVFFAQTVISTSQICLVVFQITELSESLLTILPSLCLLASVVVELFMFCLGGELLTSESFKVNLALQESCWYNLRSIDRASIMVMMAMSQRPLIITSGLFDASLSMFTKVTKGKIPEIF